MKVFIVVVMLLMAMSGHAQDITRETIAVDKSDIQDYMLSTDKDTGDGVIDRAVNYSWEAINCEALRDYLVQWWAKEAKERYFMCFKAGDKEKCFTADWVLEQVGCTESKP